MPRRAPPIYGILVAAAIGLATTIAIAWLAMFLTSGNAWHGPRADQDIGVWMADDHKTWSISRGENAWHTTVMYWHMQVSGLSMTIPTADYEARKFDFRQLPRRFRPDSLDDLYMNAWYHQTGWPFPALSCSVHWKQQVANSDIIYTVRGGVQLPRDPDFNPRALPMTPVWPGLLADTALFACARLVVAFGLSAARGHWRARRGQCRQCGYRRAGIADDAACPECGERGERVERPLRAQN